MSEVYGLDPSDVSQLLPNFPPSVLGRYPVEQLEYASSTTIENILDKVSLLATQVAFINKNILFANLKAENGAQLNVVNLEDVPRDYRYMTLGGDYTKNDEATSLIKAKDLPLVLITFRECVNPSTELFPSKDPSEKSHINVNYWIFDTPIEDRDVDGSSAPDEPVIYGVPSMLADKSHKQITATGIDAYEFDLALKSGNLHRLSEADAKDLLYQLQAASKL
jgi:hypothetical protein